MRIERRLYLNRNQPEFKNEVREAFNLVINSDNARLWEHFFKLKISVLNIQMVENLIQDDNIKIVPYIAKFVLFQKHWESHPKHRKLVEKFMDHVLKLEDIKTLAHLAQFTFARPYIKDMGYAIEKLIDAAIKLKNTDILFRLAQWTFSKPHIKDMSYLIEKLIDAAIKLKDTDILYGLVTYTFSQPHTKKMGYLIEKLINATIQIEYIPNTWLNPVSSLAQSVFSKPHTKDMEYLIEKLIDLAIKFQDDEILYNLAHHTFPREHTKEMGHLIIKLMDAAIKLKSARTLQNLALYTLNKAHIKDRIPLVAKFMDSAAILRDVKPLRDLNESLLSSGYAYYNQEISSLFELTYPLSRKKNRKEWRQFRLKIRDISHNTITLPPLESNSIIKECIGRLYRLSFPPETRTP